jgi:hypothetical protein
LAGIVELGDFIAVRYSGFLTRLVAMFFGKYMIVDAFIR